MLVDLRPRLARDDGGGAEGVEGARIISHSSARANLRSPAQRARRHPEARRCKRRRGDGELLSAVRGARRRQTGKPRSTR
jgi:hypothetical protein